MVLVYVFVITISSSYAYCHYLKEMHLFGVQEVPSSARHSFIYSIIHLSNNLSLTSLDSASSRVIIQYLGFVCFLFVWF